MRVREAAMIPALIAAFIQFFLPFVVHYDVETAATVNATLAFVAGVVTAFLVSADQGLAVLAGSANALIQLAAGFHWSFTTAQEAALGTLLTMIAAAFTRTQVTAAKPAVPLK